MKVEAMAVGTRAPGGAGAMPAMSGEAWRAAGQLDDEGRCAWAFGMLDAFCEASSQGAGALRQVVAEKDAADLMTEANKQLRKEANVTRVAVGEGVEVHVVGDIHGQVHDVRRMVHKAGRPGANTKFVFNGDFVDRGAWGMECLLFLCILKVMFPTSVYLVRGNHETKYCTSVYGFKEEVRRKYGTQGGLYARCCALFAALPLAARIGEKTLVMHGGLFRGAPPAEGAAAAAASSFRPGTSVGSLLSEGSPEEIGMDRLGSLEYLNSVKRFFSEPKYESPVEDVLWSDPLPAGEEDLCINEERGVGLCFGPKATEKFLKQEGLRLIIRSHEGPDARERRPEMRSMDDGFSIDHSTRQGQLVTVFSAPDYPQWQTEAVRSNNRGAFLTLSEPDWDYPDVTRFKAVPNRPEVEPYYELEDCPDSDVDGPVPVDEDD